MTRLEMVKMVQQLVGDTSEANFDVDEFIIPMLNAGQIDVARETKVLLQNSETIVTSGTQAYELPEDFIQIESVTLDGRSLLPLPKAQLDAWDPTRQLDAPTGSPVTFFTRARSIYLYPTPNTTSAGGLDIWYIKRPADLAADDQVSDLPVTMHEDVVRYAVMRCKERDEEFEQAMIVGQDYKQRLAESRSEAWDESAESYSSVRLLPGDY